MYKRVLIVDYGVGNHLSVAHALKRLGYSFVLSGDPKDIAEAEVFILPGVGAFQEAMKNLESRGIVEPLRKRVLEEGKPLLGICLGMQVLADSSSEGGEHKGLGFVPGRVERIAGDVRVPHVGWEPLRVTKKEPLFVRLPQGAQVYFDHSYRFVADAGHVAAVCEYGGETVAAVQKDNIFGVQFHPEKSHLAGLRLIKGFMEYAHE